MTLIRWTPFPEPFNELDKFFDFPGVQGGNFVPSLDIYQDNERVVVEAPLPGVNPEEINIAIENDVLTIEGKSEKNSEVDEKDYYRKEVRYGMFHRSVALPVSVDGQKAKAEYEDGILKITIPKEERVKEKSIKIQVKKNK